MLVGQLTRKNQPEVDGHMASEFSFLLKNTGVDKTSMHFYFYLLDILFH